MANIKFSQFTAETDIANFDDIVGYAGAVNQRITPANLASSLVTLSGGPYLPLTGGTLTGPGNLIIDGVFTQVAGAGFNDFSAQTIFNNSVDFADAIKDVGGSAGVNDYYLTNVTGTQVEWKNPSLNPYIGYKAVQVFVWPNGTPVAYTNWGSAVASNLPFDTTPLIELQNVNPGGAAATYLWACANAAGGTAGQEATFTLGADAGGTWKVRTCQHWFDQTNQVEIRVSFNINGTLIDVIDEKSTELTGDKIFYGELIQTFTSGDTLSVNVEFTVGGITPFPSDSGNRPIEISFERVL